jgi:hypothetical protein
MEDIKKYQELSKLCGSAFQIYISKLESSGFSGVEPILYNIVVNNIEYVVSSSEITKLSQKKPSFKNLFKMQYMYSELYNKLSEVYDIFAANKISISQQGLKLSSTSNALTHNYIEKIQEMFQSITDIFYSVRTIYLDKKIVHILAEMTVIKNISDLSECKNIYQGYMNQSLGHNVVDLYVVMLSGAIERLEGVSESKDTIKQIIKDIEEMKSHVLGVVDNGKHNKTNTIQKLVQKFNLIPDGMSRPLESAMKDIIENFTNLDTAAEILSSKFNKYGFIIIQKVLENPIEHNFWTLVDRNYLDSNDLLQDNLVGVNDKNLRRGTTIKLLKRIKSENNIIIKNNYFNTDSNRNYYYVLETLDGENYRFLVPWNGVKYIPASWLENVTDTKSVPSNRINSYNHILQDEIINNLKTPIISIDQLSREDVIREDSHWRSLRYKILGDVESFLKKSALDSTKQVSKIFTKDDLSKLVVQSMIDNISVDCINSPNMWSELFISYFYELDKIKKNIKKDLNESYKENIEQQINKIIKNIGSIEKSKTIELIKKSVEIVLEKYINRRSNIYLTIDKKSNIVNLSET